FEQRAIARRALPGNDWSRRNHLGRNPQRAGYLSGALSTAERRIVMVDIAAQMRVLKAFKDNFNADELLPHLIELHDQIEKAEVSLAEKQKQLAELDAIAKSTRSNALAATAEISAMRAEGVELEKVVTRLRIELGPLERATAEVEHRNKLLAKETLRL